jgi:flavodoxin
MKRILIAYHSRTGYTRRIAQMLARRLDADLDEIKIVQPFAGPIGYALCALEAITALTPALRPSRKDPAAYDLVVIGTPVWFWSLASPVRSWLTQHHFKRGRVAFFCTMGGSGAKRVFSTMAALAGTQPVATLALIDKEVDAGAEGKLDAFVHALQTAGPMKAAPTKRHVRATHVPA